MGFPKYFGVGRKSGSCIAQASGWYYLETQLAWTLMAVNGLLLAQHEEQSWMATSPVDQAIPLHSALLPHPFPQALCWGGVSPWPHLRPRLA